MENQISSAYPFKSNYLELDLGKMHYVDEGSGEAVLFLHGVPTWSYLWRNIIPFVSQGYRALAPDLLGFGLSSKPDIPYSIHDHIEAIHQFINQLNLEKVHLVLHGFGSVIGFHLLTQFPDIFKSVTFYEAHLRPIEARSMLSLPIQELSATLEKINNNQVGEGRFYVDTLLAMGGLRPLSDEELQNYHEPFKSPDSLKPLLKFFKEFPLGDEETEVSVLIREYSNRLKQVKQPKLLLYAVPGFFTTMEAVVWAKENLHNLSLHELGEALHYAQESIPDVFGEAVASFLDKL